MDSIGYALLGGSQPVGPMARANDVPHDWRNVNDYATQAIDATPTYAAAFAIGALVVLVALKAAGFRFAFGVNVGR